MGPLAVWPRQFLYENLSEYTQCIHFKGKMKKRNISLCMYLYGLGQVKCGVLVCSDLSWPDGTTVNLAQAVFVWEFKRIYTVYTFKGKNWKTKNRYFDVLFRPGPGQVWCFWFARTLVDLIGPLATWPSPFLCENLCKYTQCVHFKEKWKNK